VVAEAGLLVCNSFNSIRSDSIIFPCTESRNEESRVSNPSGGIDVSFHHCVQTDCGSHAASGGLALFHGDKRPGCELTAHLQLWVELHLYLHKKAEACNRM
jgi:hypothetical protein